MHIALLVLWLVGVIVITLVVVPRLIEVAITPCVEIAKRFGIVPGITPFTLCVIIVLLSNMAFCIWLLSLIS